jgi:hypothetical protein
MHCAVLSNTGGGAAEVEIVGAPRVQISIAAPRRIVSSRWILDEEPPARIFESRATTPDRLATVEEPERRRGVAAGRAVVEQSDACPLTALARERRSHGTRIVRQRIRQAHGEVAGHLLEQPRQRDRARHLDGLREKPHPALGERSLQAAVARRPKLEAEFAPDVPVDEPSGAEIRRGEPLDERPPHDAIGMGGRRRHPLARERGKQRRPLVVDSDLREAFLRHDLDPERRRPERSRRRVLHGPLIHAAQPLRETNRDDHVADAGVDDDGALMGSDAEPRAVDHQRLGEGPGELAARLGDADPGNARIHPVAHRGSGRGVQLQHRRRRGLVDVDGGRHRGHLAVLRPRRRRVRLLLAWRQAAATRGAGLPAAAGILDVARLDALAEVAVRPGGAIRGKRARGAALGRRRVRRRRSASASASAAERDQNRSDENRETNDRRQGTLPPTRVENKTLSPNIPLPPMSTARIAAAHWA